MDPIAVLDYTRSDDQYSIAQINQYVRSVGIEAAKGKTINLANLRTYSLDYSMSFTHSGINYGDSLKSKFSATIYNAPMELIGLLNIKQYVSSENINALSTATKSIIDPQVSFPTGGFVIRRNSNVTDIITRTFMIYSTPFNFDSRRLNSTLNLNGSQFDSMVIRLQFAVNLNKNSSLVSQIKTILSGQGFTVNSDDSLSDIPPVIERYYPPAPINSVLSEVCRDNDIAFDINSDKKEITLKSLSPDDAPQESQNDKILTFNNYIPGSYILASLSLQNYASCMFEAEAFDVQLFESISIYDDSFSEGLFANLRQIPGTIPAGSAILKGYRFYVLEYTYTDSVEKTTVSVRGTNNWLINNFKLDTFLENKIYGN